MRPVSLLVALAALATLSANPAYCSESSDGFIFGGRVGARLRDPDSLCEAVLGGKCYNGEKARSCPGGYFKTTTVVCDHAKHGVQSAFCCSRRDPRKTNLRVNLPGSFPSGDSKCALSGAVCVDRSKGGRCIGGRLWSGMCPGGSSNLCCRRSTDRPVRRETRRVDNDSQEEEQSRETSPPRSHVIPAPGSTCESVSGACHDRSVGGSECSGGKYMSGMCPGRRSVVCCVPDAVENGDEDQQTEDQEQTDNDSSREQTEDQERPNDAIVDAPTSSCVRRLSGHCLDLNNAHGVSCSGVVHVGHCPGASHVRCCVPSGETQPTEEEERGAPVITPNPRPSVDDVVEESTAEDSERDAKRNSNHGDGETRSEDSTDSPDSTVSTDATFIVDAPRSSCVTRHAGRCVNFAIADAVCDGGEVRSGLCPGNSKVRCCVPTDAGKAEEEAVERAIVVPEDTQEDREIVEESERESAVNNNNGDEESATPENNNAEEDSGPQHGRNNDNKRVEDSVEQVERERENQGGNNASPHIRPVPRPEPNTEVETQENPADEPNSGFVEAPGSKCETVGGNCQDTSKVAHCAGGSFKSGFCPGARSVRCCIPEAVNYESSGPTESNDKVPVTREEQEQEQEDAEKQEQEQVSKPEPRTEIEPEENPADEPNSGFVEAPGSKCETLGGNCQDTSRVAHCAAGDFLAGACPGARSVKCCVANAGDAAVPVEKNDQGETESETPESEIEAEKSSQNGVVSAPGSPCEDSSGQCVDTSVSPSCNAGSFASGMCPGKSSIRCCLPPNSSFESGVRSRRQSSSCAAPGTENGPCLGGFKGICAKKRNVDGGISALSRERVQNAKHHLCSSDRLVCVMERPDDVTEAEALSKTDPFSLHGRTQARWDKGYPLALDTEFEPRSESEDALAAKIADIASTLREEYNRDGKCKTLEACGGMNPCNEVAKQKQREFVSKRQCNMLRGLLADFGVVNPWCAGFTNAVLRKWKAEHLGTIRTAWEVPSDPAVAFWRDWAYCHGHDVVSTRYLRPGDIKAGDLLIKSTSHIGIATGETRVWSEDPNNWSIESIDGNTQDSGVPCAENESMPIKHDMNKEDPGRNSGYIQYACRSRFDYPAVVRLRGFTNDGKIRNRCWSALSSMCNNDRGFKCQDPRDAVDGRMPEAFCSVTPFWKERGGSPCPSGYKVRSGANKCVHTNRAVCCTK